MRVLFVANQGEIGGGEVMLLALAQQARDLGHEARVVAPKYPAQVRQRAEALGLDVIALPGRTRGSYGLALIRSAWRWDGVIWANGLFPSVATFPWPRVVHLHQEPRGRGQQVLELISRVGARRRIVPSEFMARRLPGSSVLANWTEPVRVKRAEPSPKLRVGYSGRWSVDKGVHVLARAVGLLDAQGHDVELVLAGEARFVASKDALPVEEEILRLGDKVRCLGWVEPAEYLGSVDVAVVPSVWQEPFGLVAIEAMSAKVPLVVTDAGALPEVVGPGYPWVAKANDDHSLAEVILAASEGGRGVIDAAFNRWETEYSPQAGGARLGSVLQGILTRGGS